MKKFFKIIILAGISVIAAVIFINLHIEKSMEKYMMESDIPVVDAIIIPGSKVYGDTVSYVLAARLDKGFELYKSGVSSKIIVTGDHGKTNYDEVNAMRKYLMNKGVPREDIFMDHAGFDTYSSMYRARDVFLVKSAVVASQRYHNIRAVYIGRALGLETYGAEAKDVYMGRIQFVRELFARVKAFMETQITKPKPKYLGEPIPVWGDGSLTDDGKS
ncbi:MAG: YdcF family protein [Clostridia bacterium]|nr:YdcF family protein [Clostridia bacterium]